MLRWDEHPSIQGNLGRDLARKHIDVQWVDSIDIRFPEPQYSLFGGVHDLFGHGTDINQGKIGNCWFIHGATTVARKPGRLE